MDNQDINVQFNHFCATDADCVALAYKLKWPSGFRCPRCDHHFAYTISTRKLPLYECQNCGHQSTLTSGTIMEKSRTSLRKWLLTMYIIASTKSSINAVQLSALITVSYKTAWSMLNKLRKVISETDRNILLSGVVEAKLEIYMKQPVPTYDALEREQAAIVAHTMGPNETSYLKIKLIQCEQRPRGFLNKQAEDEFLNEHVSKNVTHIDINRRFVNPPRSVAILPRLAKSAFQWMNDTFHGIGKVYSQYYLDEFCFRQNHSVKSDRCPFQFLLQLCLSSIKLSRQEICC